MTVVFTHELRARGVGASSVRRLVREDELYRVRRGAFSSTAAADALEQHRRLITSSLPMLGQRNVVSHVSAAVLHNLPVAVGQLGKVTVTRPGKGGGRITPYVHQYRTALPDEDIESVADLRRTSKARTVVDLGRCGELGAAVAAADAAMREGVSREQLTAQLNSAVRRRGLAQARTMVDLANPLSESPGESVSRVAIWWLGLPAPELQYEIRVDGATYRADFAWPQFNLLGEFDGKIKYGELLRAGETAADVVMREKQRDAALQSVGWTVVHWVYSDVMQPQKLGRLLRPKLTR